MTHKCKYCTKPFEARAGAETCSPSCKAAYNHVKKYMAIHGSINIISPSVAPVLKQEKPKEPKPPKGQNQGTNPSKWEQIQAYKKRHKFDL